MIRYILGLCACTFLLLAGACSGPDKREGPLVLAAASLQDALTEAADAWTAKGHARPVLSFAGTSALARQIKAGAPADIFISADEAWMDDLEKQGAIDPRSRISFLTNTLVLIAPAGSDVDLTIAPGFPLAATLDNGRLAIADPDAVPAGRYAKQALTRLDAWAPAAGKIVPAENVRIALALVARKEAALGIVYATDAKAEPAVRVVGTFPADSHVPISYPMALLKSARNPDAEGFRTFLLSEEAKAIFRKFGFSAPSGP